MVVEKFRQLKAKARRGLQLHLYAHTGWSAIRRATCLVCSSAVLLSFIIFYIITLLIPGPPLWALLIPRPPLGPSALCDVDVGFPVSYELQLRNESIISELKKPPLEVLKSQKVKVKIILLWTPWFGESDWICHLQYNNPPGPLISLDDDRHCLLTPERLYLNISKAIVFHGRDLNIQDLPMQRAISQRWIYFGLEPPTQSGTPWENEDAWDLINAQQFNWTMSYSTKSSVQFSYGKIMQQSANVDTVSNRIAEFSSNFSKRPFDAIFIDSHCHTHSQRTKIVEFLRRSGITVDIRGRCNGRYADFDYPDFGNRDKVKDFFAKYRFYFAFENSICDDYATEKFFIGLKLSELAGVIPVVYGGANYSALFQSEQTIPAAFVTAHSQKTKELADIIKQLSKGSPQDVEPYFDWQRRFMVEKKVKWTTVGWRRLCEALWRDKTNSFVEEIRDHYGSCHRPSFIRTT